MGKIFCIESQNSERNILSGNKTTFQEWTNNYNEAEKKIQQIEKDASGVVSERFKQFFRQQMAEQQHIQYVNWKKIDDMLRPKN